MSPKRNANAIIPGEKSNRRVGLLQPARSLIVHEVHDVMDRGRQMPENFMCVEHVATGSRMRRAGTASQAGGEVRCRNHRDNFVIQN